MDQVDAKNNKKWFVRDAGGISIALLAWVFMLFSGIYVIIWQINEGRYVSLPVGLFLFFMTCYCHYQTMTTCPGIYKGSPPSDEDTDMILCDECNHMRPQLKVEHCEVCHTCILFMDHHCPWMNNCIGLKNFKLFVQYLCYVCTTCLYVLLCTTYQYACRGARCGYLEPAQKWLVAIALMFMFFCMCMLSMQAYSLANDFTLRKVHQYFCPTTEHLTQSQLLQNHLTLLFVGQPCDRAASFRQRMHTVLMPVPLHITELLYRLYSEPEDIT